MKMISEKRWKKMDEQVYELLKASVDIMPKRLQKLIAFYYTDARLRRLYLDRLGVKMGETTFPNLGLKLMISGKQRYGVEIGEGVSIGGGLTLVGESSPNNSRALKHHPYVVEHLIKDEKIIIEDEAWLGANVTILPGVRIGKGCIIGAGSVVTENTEPYSIYAGTPAGKIRSLEFVREEGGKGV